MTREELQQELRQLDEMKVNEVSKHITILREIEEAQRDSLAAINEEDHKFRIKMTGLRRKADSTMRKLASAEHIRHKAECIRLESTKQQLFADYKAQEQS